MHYHGHKVYWDTSIGEWRYLDTDEIILSDERPCPECGSLPTGEGHDSCLGELPGVIFACCGHGGKNRGYITFENGVILRGTFKLDKEDTERRQSQM